MHTFELDIADLLAAGHFLPKPLFTFSTSQVEKVLAWDKFICWLFQLAFESR